MGAGVSGILAEVRTAGKRSGQVYLTGAQTMRAVMLDRGEVRVEDAPFPAPAPGHSLIKVRLAGICNTDLELQRGYYGFSGVPGHEFVGEVVQSDDVRLLGKRVAGEINLTCGHCSYCSRGEERHCSRRTVLGIIGHPGAFAQFLSLPHKNLHVLPDSITDREAVFVEPLAAALHAGEQARLTEGEPVAVLGDGKLGLLVAQAAKAMGAEVSLYGKHDRKRRLASAWGINVDASSSETYAVVIDCTGSPEGLNTAIRMTRPLGIVIMKSTVERAVTLDMAPAIVNEISLLGSRCGPFEPAIRLLAEKKVGVAEMIDEEYPLEQAADAFAHAATKGSLKILLRP